MRPTPLLSPSGFLFRMKQKNKPGKKSKRRKSSKGQRKTGYGHSLIIIDGPVGAGKSTLGRMLKMLPANAGRVCVIDEPLHEFAPQLQETIDHPSRQNQVKLQCHVTRAWERRQLHIFRALREGKRVIIIRGPQGFSLFDSPLIPNFARDVFVHRITTLVQSWMVWQGLPEYLPPTRLCLEIHGRSPKSQASNLYRNIATRDQVGDNLYTIQDLEGQLERFKAINSGHSTLATRLHVAPGVSAPFHVAFCDVSNWIQRDSQHPNISWYARNREIPPSL